MTTEEYVEELKNLPKSDDGYPCMECGGGIDEDAAISWLIKTINKVREEAIWEGFKKSTEGCNKVEKQDLFDKIKGDWDKQAEQLINRHE